MQRFAAIQHVQSWFAEIQPSIRQFTQQLAYHGGVFGGALPDAQDRFAPILADSQGGHHLLAGERRGINQ